MRLPLKPIFTFLFFAVTLGRSWAFAETITVSLAERLSVESSSAVLNSSLGIAHPPLQIQNWDAGGGQQTTPISVGSGLHGSFNSSTYLHFHDGVYAGDQVIRVNTDIYPELEFTDFLLENGWVLKPTGSRPLVIRSLSNIVIRGIIDCSGENGEELSSQLSDSPRGGIGRCGGASGGAGGSQALAVSQGSDNAIPNSGGGGGSTSGGGGGGGAGMDTSAPSPAPGLTIDDLSPSGVAGTPGTDISFSLVGGGAGGGGGERYDDPLDAAAFYASGGGGGAGGGSISIHSVGHVEIAATGRIFARGGAGGGSTAAYKAGGGGGGAGGSIQIFVGGDLTIDGVIDATGGAGGVSAGGNGGNGGSGRTWVADSDTNPTGSGTVDPMWIIPVLGIVNYQEDLFSVISKVIDTRATRPEYLSLDIDADVPTPSVIGVEVAVGDQPFDVSEAQWMPATSMALLNQARYMRFKFSIDNRSLSQPVQVRSVSLNYRPRDHGQFEFASCQLVDSNSGSQPPSTLRILTLLMTLFTPVLIWGLLREVKATSRVRNGRRGANRLT